MLISIGCVKDMVNYMTGDTLNEKKKSKVSGYKFLLSDFISRIKCRFFEICFKHGSKDQFGII